KSRCVELGWEVEEMRLVEDNIDKIAAVLGTLSDSGSTDVVIKTGGTGGALRDVTPEAVRQIAHREIPGFGELMRSEGLKTTKFAPLSRGGGFTRNATLIVNLPAPPGG